MPEFARIRIDLIGDPDWAALLEVQKAAFLKAQELGVGVVRNEIRMLADEKLIKAANDQYSGNDVRVDLDAEVKIEVLPQTRGVKPFVIHAHATTATLHDPRFPSATFVEAKGKLVGHVLLAEDMQQVQARNPHHELSRKRRPKCQSGE